VKMFDADKNTIMIGLPCGEKNYDDMLSRFHLIPESYGQTNRQTDGRTDGQIIYLYKHFTVHTEHGRKTAIANECELIARSGTCHLRPAKS